MKKLVLTAVASLACLAAFGQGKISFQNNSTHLVYYDPVRVSDASLSGKAVSPGLMPSGITLVGDLYVGTSSSSLSLISSTSFGAAPGSFSTMSVQVPAIPGGTSVFVVAQVRDSAHAAEATWTPGFQGQGLGWYGASQEFTFVLGTSSISYPAMWSTAGNWAAGTFPLDSSAGAGALGAIGVAAVPEPTTFALAGLGAAAMLIFRRRK